MQRVMLLPALAALVVGLLVTTVTVQSPDQVLRTGLTDHFMQVEQDNVNDLPVLIPVLLLLPSSDASIRKALAVAGTIESLILKVCGTRAGMTYTPEQMTCRSQPITGEDWERAIGHLYNYEVTLYRPGEETPQPGSYNVPRGALSKLQLVDAF